MHRAPPAAKSRLLTRALALLGILVFVAFALFVIRETAAVVELAATVDLRLGRAVLALLLSIYAVCLGIPLFLYFRLPAALRPPAADTGPEFERHLARLARRLSRNPHLGRAPIAATDRAAIEGAIRVLDDRARDDVVGTAGLVFLTTAISQSGRLDALMVLVIQTRLVWRIAHVYTQRASGRELLWLYANVAASVFAAQAVEDIDVAETIEPVVGEVLSESAIGGLLAALPVVGRLAAPVTALATDALLTGTANAFFTLRVGCIARGYCRALSRPDRRRLRRSATVEAASLLGAVGRGGAATVSAAVVAVVRRRGLSWLVLRGPRSHPV